MKKLLIANFFKRKNFFGFHLFSSALNVEGGMDTAILCRVFLCRLAAMIQRMTQERACICIDGYKKDQKAV